ncbi:hypothetical protein ACF0H5_018327 [Mactra antiquata]
MDRMNETINAILVTLEKTKVLSVRLLAGVDGQITSTLKVFDASSTGYGGYMESNPLSTVVVSQKEVFFDSPKLSQRKNAVNHDIAQSIIAVQEVTDLDYVPKASQFPQMDSNIMSTRIDFVKMSPEVDSHKMFSEVDFDKMSPEVDRDEMSPEVDCDKVFAVLSTSK